jgi:hypothetical protein
LSLALGPTPMGIAMPGTICNPFLKGSFLKGAHTRIAKGNTSFEPALESA